MFASRVVQILKSSAQKRPLLVNSIIFGSFYTGAEFAQQTYDRMSKLSLSPTSTSIEESKASVYEVGNSQIWTKKDCNEQTNALGVDSLTQSTSYNWAQLKRYAIYGSFIAGPILHGWYKWLDTVCKGKSVKTVSLKLFCDQFILTPPLIVVFFTSMSLMEGKPNVFEECKAKFAQTFKTSCMFWLPVQFLNFSLVPPTLRVFFVSVAGFCWVNILCYLKSTPLPEHIDRNN